MNRRHLLSSFGLGVLGATLTSCNNPDSSTDSSPKASAFTNKKTIHWHMACSWPKDFPGLGFASVRFAKMVNTMSGGDLHISVHGAGEVVSAFEVFNAVQGGMVQMGHSRVYYQNKRGTASSFFSAIPYGLDSREMSSWLHNGGGMALWDKLYAGYNIKPFIGGTTGVQMAGWFNRKLETVDDLKDLKMRISGLGGDVLRRLGGMPIDMAGRDLFAALKNGQLDAAEWLGPWNDLAFGFYKVSKYYYYPGWHEPGSLLEFTINLEAWNSLPADLKMIVEVAAKATHLSMVDEYMVRNYQALHQLKSDYGVQVVKLPDEMLRQLRDTAEQVTQEMVQNNPQAAPIYTSFQRFAKQVREQHQVSEIAYNNARSL